MADKSTSKDPDILAQFQEFLDAKAQADADEQQAEDFEVEIWDEKGRGVRTRRSHAKPFLQSLGIDIDESGSDESDNSDDDSGKSGSKTTRQSKGKTATSTGTQSTIRKYFVSQAKK